jgi:hypothetical protein
MASSPLHVRKLGGGVSLSQGRLTPVYPILLLFRCFWLSCVSVLCCVVLLCVVLHCIVLCCVVLHCVVLCCVALYCVVLCCIVLCCIVLCCIALCCVDGSVSSFGMELCVCVISCVFEFVNSNIKNRNCTFIIRNT